jgi:hypothetical protein
VRCVTAPPRLGDAETLTRMATRGRRRRERHHGARRHGHLLLARDGGPTALAGCEAERCQGAGLAGTARLRGTSGHGVLAGPRVGLRATRFCAQPRSRMFLDTDQVNMARRLRRTRGDRRWLEFQPHRGTSVQALDGTEMAEGSHQLFAVSRPSFCSKVRRVWRLLTDKGGAFAQVGRERANKFAQRVRAGTWHNATMPAAVPFA